MPDRAFWPVATNRTLAPSRAQHCSWRSWTALERFDARRRCTAGPRRARSAVQGSFPFLPPSACLILSIMSSIEMSLTLGNCFWSSSLTSAGLAAKSGRAARIALAISVGDVQVGQFLLEVAARRRRRAAAPPSSSPSSRSQMRNAGTGVIARAARPT